MRVIFFGTPSFAADVVQNLIENGVTICAVVTRPDRPRGRSGKPCFSAVKQRVLEQFPAIPIYQPDRVSTEAFGQELARYAADLFVVVAYGEIIKQHILDLPRLGCINLHASLLPAYRGAAPIHFALLHGEEKTGVTVIEMVAKMDAGPILSQEEVPIAADDDFLELEEKLCVAGANQLLKVIRQYKQGKVAKVTQDETAATFATKVDPSLAQLDWNQPADVLYRRIRAFTPRPGAWCFVSIEGVLKRMKVFQARLVAMEGKAGATLSYSKSGWRIACGHHALDLLNIQLEGKKKLSIAEFKCGFQTAPQLVC
ncbi:MAG: methionyl-tRNA formyltransferase [Chlamydiota bacterium]